MSNLKTLRHCNDRVGARGRLHKNLILAPEGIVQFVGESIPPRCTVVSVGYKKDGSHTSWTLELAPETYLVIFDQDWETGEWFTARTWSGAIDALMAKIEHVVVTTSDVWAPYTLPSRESVKRCIREVFPDCAQVFDGQENNSQNDQFAALIEAQRKLALAQEEAASVIREIPDLEEAHRLVLVRAERLEKEAAKLRASAEAAKEILRKGKINISELKALMKME